MDADMSIDMTIRLVVVGTLAGVVFMSLAMGQDSYSGPRRNRHTAHKQPNTPVAADEAQGRKYPQS